MPRKELRENGAGQPLAGRSSQTGRRRVVGRLGVRAGALTRATVQAAPDRSGQPISVQAARGPSDQRVMLQKMRGPSGQRVTGASASGAMRNAADRVGKNLGVGLGAKGKPEAMRRAHLIGEAPNAAKDSAIGPNQGREGSVRATTAHARIGRRVERVQTDRDRTGQARIGRDRAGRGMTGQDRIAHGRVADLRFERPRARIANNGIDLARSAKSFVVDHAVRRRARPLREERVRHGHSTVQQSAHRVDHRSVVQRNVARERDPLVVR